MTAFRPSRRAILASPLLVVPRPLTAAVAGRPGYTRAPVSLLDEPRTTARAGLRLDANASVRILGGTGAFADVQATTGERGFVPARALSDVWCRAYKAERVLALVRGGREETRYRMALSPDRPGGDKVKRGDGATPVGRFYVCEDDARPLAARYGARSLRLSYPSVPHARRGLRDRLIDRSAYTSIVLANRRGAIPEQESALGGSIRIHGGGSTSDWTLGCLALDDADVVALAHALGGQGARVDVFESEAEAREADLDGALATRILRGAEAQLRAPALYTSFAMGAPALAYPGGDIDEGHAVCTDIVSRAFRTAGLDLQALVHEDRLAHPERYGREPPNPHVDHRRVRTLDRFFAAHAERVPVPRSPAGFRAGDIVMFETGIENGVDLDHIGIVGAERDDAGYPLVINIWTVGHRTSAMPLLGRPYPTVTRVYRLGHPYDWA